jgi:hypothetical protein
MNAPHFSMLKRALKITSNLKISISFRANPDGILIRNPGFRQRNLRLCSLVFRFSHSACEDNMIKSAKTVLVLSTLALLSACGTDPGERALTGGAAGAAGGAAIGAAFGNPIAGAVVGGVAGAGTGALTSKNQVSLDPK